MQLRQGIENAAVGADGAGVFRQACEKGLEASCRNGQRRLIAPGCRLDNGEEPRLAMQRAREGRW
jgi:hypothetical protein